MSLKKFVKPANPDVKVRDPQARNFDHLPVEGKLVTWTTYWERQLRDGDIVVTDAPPEVKAEAPAEGADQKPTVEKRGPKGNRVQDATPATPPTPEANG